MSGSRQVSDVLGRFPGSCESLAESCPHLYNRELTVERPLQNMQSILARAIEVEIIPRLMLAHRPVPGTRSRRRQAPRQFTDEETKEFARITVNHDVTVSQAFAEALMEQGATAEQLFTSLFAPAARLMGEMWERDSLTFSEVAIGLSRINQLIHVFSPFFEGESEAVDAGKSALLVPLPGEHHSLGVLLVEQFFRRAGWSVWSPSNVSDAQLITVVKQERFDMVGISVTCHCDLDRVATLIAAIRGGSLNRDLRIMVGGRLMNEHPEYALRVGADSTDVDGSQAVRRWDGLPAVRARCS